MGTVDDYLAEQTENDRVVIEHVYDIARDLVPDVEQGKGYGMPALVYKGKSLISVMRTAKHIGVYPFSPEAIAAAADELVGFDRDKGTVRFQPDNPIPDAAVRTMVHTRRAQIDR
ncbi:iron chaperone [Microbacterium sp. R86528]|uniref:iron chaperone n=1 Tax=Microbacterium sp. R86528 TaxID=3093864 RepID=UPI0037C70D40